MRNEPASLLTEQSFGKTPTTFARRPTSRFSLSRLFAVLTTRLTSSGSSITVHASLNPRSRHSMALGTSAA